MIRPVMSFALIGAVAASPGVTSENAGQGWAEALKTCFEIAQSGSLDAAKGWLSKPEFSSAELNPCTDLKGCANSFILTFDHPSVSKVAIEVQHFAVDGFLDFNCGALPQLTEGLEADQVASERNELLSRLENSGVLIRQDGEVLLGCSYLGKRLAVLDGANDGFADFIVMTGSNEPDCESNPRGGT